MHAKTAHKELAKKKLPRAGGIGLLAALPHMAKLALISKRWRSEVLGGVIRTLRSGAQQNFVRGTRRCPDGQKPHPSVCQRGWRGDLCQGCVAFRY
ncbi:MAG: hypothetical protein HQM02_09000 [Magnetococcales bacterium]|nr:hypothetical protein [Magnetococcales bacterium]